MISASIIDEGTETADETAPVHDGVARPRVWATERHGVRTRSSACSRAWRDPCQGRSRRSRPWDAWIRAGKSALPQPLPLTLGSDLAGNIVAKGSGVSGLALGDKIFGITNSRFIGAYAEYALASTFMVARKPTSLTYVEAASVPVVAVTAWQALFDQARLQPGEVVLIHGAAGNVGAYAVQFARRAGLRVIATAAAEDPGVRPRTRRRGGDRLPSRPL